MSTLDPLDEFPRQYARTRGLSLGIPRSFTVSPDGERVVFLRTRAGADPVSCLWVIEVATARSGACSTRGLSARLTTNN